MNIRVAATSTSCLDYLPENNDIDVIRMKIFINDQEYIDGVNLTAYEFYNILNKNPRLIPKTSQPSVGEIVTYFKKVSQQGYKKIFVTTLSKHLSGSYNSILQAKQIVKNEVEVIVYDTKTVCFSEGYFALQAHRLFAKGASVTEVINYLDFLRQNNTIFFVVNSLTYLIQNGRLSKTQSLLGRFFRIKPILQVNEEGEIVLIEKTFNIEKAFLYIIERIRLYTKNKEFLIHILFTGNPVMRQKLRLILEQKLHLTNILEIPSAPSIGAHVGNNVLGVGVILKS
ncbi:DegV family protein [Candidatus Phytoplasma melaleucae]|uniref:DegV family protein n=1 Tax=Candidatus Phytoplasma melaleucae TaxID=2982630 RepID=A0ABT9DCN4_9MOLU|nr:DegV family protein ['Melaleuca sp.' phytoplasma]MDO8167892.1 DegV family protein ['Melaleuca sp.' phytoplasma]